MRFREIVAGEIEPVAEGKPVEPLDATQATARAKRLRAATAKLADLQAANNIKLRAAQRRLTDL